MIRPATVADTKRLIEMGQSFVNETSYSLLISVNPERLSGIIGGILENPDGVVLVSGSDATVTGMIAMVVYNHPFSGERTAFEIVWWVEPESRGDGIRLLRAAEEWAREQGAKHMQMVAPNERVAALYQRLGYGLVETSFQRSL